MDVFHGYQVCFCHIFFLRGASDPLILISMDRGMFGLQGERDGFLLEPRKGENFELEAIFRVPYF